MLGVRLLLLTWPEPLTIDQSGNSLTARKKCKTRPLMEMNGMPETSTTSCVNLAEQEANRKLLLEHFLGRSGT